MKDAENGRLLWDGTADWNSTDIVEAHIPKEILACRAVAREVNFSSKWQLDEFKLTQIVRLFGNIIEVWNFDFGFVIPNSTNTWEQIIDAAEPEEILPASTLSGNIIIETTFYNGNLVLRKNEVKLFYE